MYKAVRFVSKRLGGLTPKVSQTFGKFEVSAKLQNHLLMCQAVDRDALVTPRWAFGERPARETAAMLVVDLFYSP